MNAEGEMEQELKALRDEIVMLRAEVSRLSAGGVHHHHYGVPQPLLPQPLNPQWSRPMPVWCGPQTSTSVSLPFDPKGVTYSAQ